jgi:hypothetical protein
MFKAILLGLSVGVITYGAWEHSLVLLIIGSIFNGLVAGEGFE